MRKLLTTLALGGILAFGMPDDAQAQTVNVGDQLVNVQIGDITIEDINVAVAAQIVAAICANVDLEAAVAIIGAIDADPTGATDQVCQIGQGRRGQTLTVTQN